MKGNSRKKGEKKMGEEGCKINGEDLDKDKKKKKKEQKGKSQKKPEESREAMEEESSNGEKNRATESNGGLTSAI